MFTTGTIGIPEPFDEPVKWSNDFKSFIKLCLAFEPEARGTASELLEVSISICQLITVACIS